MRSTLRSTILFNALACYLRLAARLRMQSAIFRSLASCPLLGELTNIPTDTLIDMLCLIVAGEVAITPNDAAEIEQIQRELQRRGRAENWSLGTIN